MPKGVWVQVPSRAPEIIKTFIRKDESFFDISCDTKVTNRSPLHLHQKYEFLSRYGDTQRDFASPLL